MPVGRHAPQSQTFSVEQHVECPRDMKDISSVLDLSVLGFQNDLPAFDLQYDYAASDFLDGYSPFEAPPAPVQWTSYPAVHGPNIRKSMDLPHCAADLYPFQATGIWNAGASDLLDSAGFDYTGMSGGNYVPESSYDFRLQSPDGGDKMLSSQRQKYKLNLNHADLSIVPGGVPAPVNDRLERQIQEIKKEKFEEASVIKIEPQIPQHQRLKAQPPQPEHQCMNPQPVKVQPKPAPKPKRVGTEPKVIRKSKPEKIEHPRVYTREERKKRIASYHAKRLRRTFNKKIKYHCRKKFADRRQRVAGRFVKMTAVQKAVAMLKPGQPKKKDVLFGTCNVEVNDEFAFLPSLPKPGSSSESTVFHI